MKIIKILGAAFENDFGGVVNLSNHGHLLKDALWRIFLCLNAAKQPSLVIATKTLFPSIRELPDGFSAKTKMENTGVSRRILFIQVL